MIKFLKRMGQKVHVIGYRDCEDIGERFLREGPRVEVLVDCGCWDGNTSKKWGAAAGAKRIIGLEFIENAIALATANGIEARKADLSERWPVEDGECDLVVSSQNLEHMHRSLFYVQEMYRILKPGGYAVVLTENLASWANIVSLIFGWQPFSTTVMEGVHLGHPILHNADIPKDFSGFEEALDKGISGATGHVRVLAYRGLKELMEKANFVVTRYETSCYAPAWGWLSRALCKIDRRHGHFLIIECVKPLASFADSEVRPIENLVQRST